MAEKNRQKIANLKNGEAYIVGGSIEDHMGNTLDFGNGVATARILGHTITLDCVAPKNLDELKKAMEAIQLATISRYEYELISEIWLANP